MNIGQRIIEIAKENELSQGKMGLLLGKTRGYLNAAATKDSSIGSDVLSKIIDKFPEYNIIWVITGEGEKLLKEEFPLSGVLESGVRYESDQEKALKHQFYDFTEYVEKKFDDVYEKFAFLDELKKAELGVIPEILEKLKEEQTKG